MLKRFVVAFAFVALPLAAALEPALKRIAALSSVSDLPALVAELHTMGVNVFFSFGAEADFKEASVVRAIADQGGLGLPDRDYYFRDDPKSVELRKEYLGHVGRMMGLLEPAARPGPDMTAEASAPANTVMRIESALAKAALDVVA